MAPLIAAMDQSVNTSPDPRWVGLPSVQAEGAEVTGRVVTFQSELSKTPVGPDFIPAATKLRLGCNER